MKPGELFDKSYINKWLLSVLSGVLAVGAVIYLSYHVYDNFSPGLTLADAVITTQTEEISAYAYIMRDEVPIYSSVSSGSVAPALNDGARVSMGAKIADVYSVSSPDAESRMSELEKQLSLLTSHESSASVVSTAGIENEIYEELFTLRKHCDSGSYSDAISLRTSILVNVTKKLIRSEQLDSASQTARLEAEKASLRSRLGSCLDTVYSGSTGYYFSGYDGYGRIFSSDKVDSLTFDEFMSLTESEPEASENGRICVGSLVTDFAWYIACVLDKSDAASLSSLPYCRLSFTYSDTELETTLYRIIPENPGKRAVAVFRCGKMPAGFDYTRTQPVKISSVEYKGYKLPAQALRVLDGYEGVYILDEVTVRFRRVNVIYRDESGSYIICTGKSADAESEPEDDIYPYIKTNDIVVVSGKELYTGKVVGKSGIGS